MNENLIIPSVLVDPVSDDQPRATVISKNIYLNGAKLGRKTYFKLFNYLQIEDLSRLSSTCKQLNYFVQEYVKELQVTVFEEEGAHHIADEEKNHVILKDIDPGQFFFPNPPFQRVTRLYLNFNGELCSKINLIELTMLESLKIRGPLIKLSSNKLTSVTDVDIEDVDCCENQVFPNIKNFNVEFDLEEMSQIYNSTESKALEFIFIKAADILKDKKRVETVKFTLSMFMGNHESILVFEKFVDSVELFLNDHEEYCDEGKINIVLKHNKNYLEKAKEFLEEEEVDKNKLQDTLLGVERRFEAGFRRLNYLLPNQHYNFKIDYEDLPANNIIDYNPFLM